MIEYMIESDWELQALSEKVTKAIRKGWKPTGGVAVDETLKLYLQAMVKD